MRHLVNHGARDTGAWTGASSCKIGCDAAPSIGKACWGDRTGERTREPPIQGRKSFWSTREESMAESRASLPPRSIAACSDRPARGYLALLNANRLPSEAEPIKAFSWYSSVDADDDDDDEVGLSC